MLKNLFAIKMQTADGGSACGAGEKPSACGAGGK